MKCILSTILLLVPITLGITTNYVFEFGVDQGDVLYTKEGSIYLLHQETAIDIPLPSNYAVTYVKVTVNALSSPKVDYDNIFRRVTIKYSWIQVSQSTYSIVVKGVVI